MGTVLNAQAAASGGAFSAYIDWAAGLEWDDISPTAKRRVVLVLADDMGATFSAVDEPEVTAVRKRMVTGARWVEGPLASLLAAGRPRVSVRQAAMGNGLAMGWNELDEGYRNAVCHAGLYVLPALLASAEAEGRSLEELLRAALLGYETVARIARAYRFPALTIHPHALLSPVGAAAGIGFLRRLPAPELLSAVAGAATLGMAGPFNHALQGVLARNTWAAQAAASGLAAVEWAQCGIGGQASSLHDVYVTALGADRVDLTAFAPHAGDGWAVESGYHKINASCQYTHSAIEAVEALLADHPELRGGESLVGIEVEAHPLAYALDDAQPATTLGAKFSVPHAVAATLVHGDGGVGSFDAASLGDPRVARLRNITRLVPFADVRPPPDDRPARVALTDRDGERFEALCWSAAGGPDRPMAEAALWNKVATLSRAHAPGLAPTLRAIAQLVDDGNVDGLARPWRRWLDDVFASTPAT
ncbi:MmgE/PrpD family protein [soil metagenome]